MKEPSDPHLWGLYPEKTTAILGDMTQLLEETMGDFQQYTVCAGSLVHHKRFAVDAEHVFTSGGSDITLVLQNPCSIIFVAGGCVSKSQFN